MKIIKNGFYCLKKMKEEEEEENEKKEKIIISSNLRVSIFDNRSKSLDIEIWENSKLDFFCVINWDRNTDKNFVNINFIQKEVNSYLNVRCLLLSKNNTLNTKIYSNLWANEVKSDVRILGIVWEKWFINLDWILQIDEGIKRVVWNLKEDNLFLWNTWKINWIPTLLVRSSDVKASHSCKIERISDEKLFYLRSRWIWKENVLNMMIYSYINELFSQLELIDKKFFDDFLCETTKILI